MADEILGERTTSAQASGQRPFRVLGLQQVALGGQSRDRLRELWVGLLGVTIVGSYESDQENVREDIARLGTGPGAVELDLMEPLRPGERPDVSVPALHHIGLWVDDLPKAVQWLGARGMRFTPGGIRKGAAGHDVCFIHPKAGDGKTRSGEGVLIELVQAPPAILEAHASAGGKAEADDVVGR